MICRLLLFIFILFCANIGFSQNTNCFWGTDNEKTTYQIPYNSLLGPNNIPVLSSSETPSPNASVPAATSTAISPETAITVATSDGNAYSYYYRETVQYQKFIEYKWVFEPKEEYIMDNISVFNPCLGQYEQRPTQKSVITPFPVWHEKAFYQYKPIRVRQKVIIPVSVSSLNSSPITTPNDGSATTILRTNVVE